MTERKSFTVEVKDAEKGLVEARFATFNVKDHDGDWTTPGAFDTGAEVPIGAYGHRTYLEGDLPVGKGTILETKEDVRLQGQFFLDTESGRDHFAVIKHLGPKQEWSYEYSVTEVGDLTKELRDQGVRRVINKTKVFGVSPVLAGAGIGTGTLMVKSIADKLCPACQALIDAPVEEPKNDTELQAKMADDVARFERTRQTLARQGLA